MDCCLPRLYLLFFKAANMEDKKRNTMNNDYTAIIKQDGDWWIGWIEEVPGVNCQEKTYKELIETLKVTLKEALEFNRQDALALAGTDYKEERIAISL